jgi:adenylate cyclase
LASAQRLLGAEVAIQLVRVLGASAARVADAAVTSFIVNVGPPAIERDPSGLELARANSEAILLLPALTQGFDTMLRHQIEALRRPVDRSDVAGGAEIQQRTVGFVDLVGSTTLANTLEAADLSAALTRFDATSSEIVTQGGGRVVKLIGDEVMFVTRDPGEACRIALTLFERFAGDGAVTPRGAIACGEMLLRGGDYYGPVVNLASRVAQIAVPSELLVTEQVAAGSKADDIAFEPAGKRLLKGFETPVSLLTVSRR